MDKLDLFRDSRVVPDSDLPNFRGGGQYFQPKPGKTFLSWKLVT